VELAQEYGEVVRVVSPLGRDGHQVTVGTSSPQVLRVVGGGPEGEA
jgi:hypothetical protein